MTITTYTEFVAAVAALDIDGVTRAYLQPPGQVSTADLPCSYPSLPTGGENPFTGDAAGGWPALRVDLVVLIESWAQSTRASNYTAAVAMMDAISEALRAAELAKSRPRWTIRTEIVSIGDTPYWAVTCAVEANG
jgi:hypothetical protein